MYFSQTHLMPTNTTSVRALLQPLLTLLFSIPEYSEIIFMLIPTDCSTHCLLKVSIFNNYKDESKVSRTTSLEIGEHIFKSWLCVSTKKKNIEAKMLEKPQHLEYLILIHSWSKSKEEWNVKINKIVNGTVTHVWQPAITYTGCLIAVFSVIRSISIPVFQELFYHLLDFWRKKRNKIESSLQQQFSCKLHLTFHTLKGVGGTDMHVIYTGRKTCQQNNSIDSSSGREVIMILQAKE